MTTTAIDPDRTEARLTNLENFQVDTLERLARLETKVDTLTAVVEELTVTVRETNRIVRETNRETNQTVQETNRETNRRIDRLFYLGAATGAGIIAALLLQPLIAALSS